MTTPSASFRQFLAPGDTVNGNVKVVEFGLFGGRSLSSRASPTTGASASTAVHIAVASFMENLLLLRMYRLRMKLAPSSAVPSEMIGRVSMTGGCPTPESKTLRCA